MIALSTKLFLPNRWKSPKRNQAEWKDHCSVLGNTSNNIKKNLTYQDYLKIFDSFQNCLCIQKIKDKEFGRSKKGYDGRKRLKPKMSEV